MPDPTTLSDLGEFGLIERIKKHVTKGPKCIIIGIGDDTAVIDPPPGRFLLVTADAFVEGIHFRQDYATFYQIGWKAMAANLSDIAAMGGEPVCATVSLCLPSSVPVEGVEALYRGMDVVAARFRCAVVGGDTTSAPHGIVLSIALIGSVAQDRLTLRGGACVGDLICVTGDLGGAQAGLEALQHRTEGPDVTYALRRHREPTPRLAEAHAAGEAVRLHAAIDVSDGLSSEVHHICRESGVGARLWAAALPVHEATRRIAALRGRSPLDYALSGGEDFEILFTLAPSYLPAVQRAVEEATGTPVAAVGEIVEAARGVVLVDEDGAERILRASGYRHF